MKRIFSITVIFLILAKSGLAQADTILNRYKQYLFQNESSAESLEQILETLDNDGKWTDINYQDKERGYWQPLIHMKRTRQLAFAFADRRSSYFHQEKISQAVNRAIDHWLQNRYVCPNWWHNEIGVPQQMRDIIVLMGTDLLPARKKQSLEILGQYRIQNNSTGANLAWSADLGLHYASLINDTALLKKCRDLLVNEIRITTGDGVQPDYSFHQHDKRLQMYQYGAAFLTENVRLAWQLRNTMLAFPKEKIAILTDFVLNGWQWMTRGINTVPGTMDRSASRRNALHSADIREMLPYLIDLAPQLKSELDTIIDHQNGKGNLNGFRYYPYSDFAAYHHPDFSFFLKTISSRTLSTESINNENLKGHLLNSGDAYLIRDGQEYFNLMPFWNWEYLPGVTSFREAERMKRLPFAGSVSDGVNGFTSMDYLMETKDRSRFISAKKSWFCFNGKVVCLVASLKGHGVDSAYTAMDQSRWEGKVYVNKKRHAIGEGDHAFDELKWVQHRNFVYLPLTSTAAKISLHQLDGSWVSINTSETAVPLRDSVFMPVLLHQNLNREQSFGYLMQLCKSPAKAAKLAKHKAVKIIRNDSTCQAVDFLQGTVMAAFFEAGSLKIHGDIIEVDRPCLIMIIQNKIFVSDPSQTLNSVTIKFNNKIISISLPAFGFTANAVLPK